MNELYLILHKVCGKPTFDIAQRMCKTHGLSHCQPDCGLWRAENYCSEAEGWIIPTSGHRTYPYWQIELTQIAPQDFKLGPQPFGVPIIPDSWPDHYQVTSRHEDKPLSKRERHSAKSLLIALGLPTNVHPAMSGKLTRRI